MIEEALKYYDFYEPKATLIRHNENMTYAIADGDSKYLLRIHKAADGLDFNFQCGDISRNVFIESEIELLLKLNTDYDLQIQRPVKNKFGEYITKLSSGDYATILLWIDGVDMAKINITNEVAYEIGKGIGGLHNHMLEMPPVNRYIYDECMIDRVQHEIEKAYELKHMDERHFQSIHTYLLGFKDFIMKEKKNFILIHADFSKSNLIYHEKQIIPIDFSLSGYALPEMDLADMSCSLNDKSLTHSMIEGYRSVGKYCLNELYIDICFAFSIILYIAIHHNRFAGEEKSQQSLDRWTNSIINPINQRMLV